MLSRTHCDRLPAYAPALPAIYHFTDISNLPEILAAGELRCHRLASTQTDIGAPSVKDLRTKRRVPCGPGGMVCDYAPFYYASRSPMLFSIKSGNVPGVDPDQRLLVYLVSSAEAAYAAGLRCVFSDGNAATAFTAFQDDPDLLDEFVDWPLMRARYWNNTADDPDRRRRRMAEFLVHRGLPLELMTEVGVYDQTAKAQVIELMREAGVAIKVAIRGSWYF